MTPDSLLYCTPDSFLNFVDAFTSWIPGTTSDALLKESIWEAAAAADENIQILIKLGSHKDMVQLHRAGRQAVLESCLEGLEEVRPGFLRRFFSMNIDSVNAMMHAIEDPCTLSAADQCINP